MLNANPYLVPKTLLQAVVPLSRVLGPIGVDADAPSVCLVVCKLATVVHCRALRRVGVLPTAIVTALLPLHLSLV